MTEPTKSKPGQRTIYRLLTVIADSPASHREIQITRRYRTVFDATVALLRMMNEGTEIKNAHIDPVLIDEGEPTDDETARDGSTDDSADDECPDWLKRLRLGPPRWWSGWQVTSRSVGTRLAG